MGSFGVYRFVGAAESVRASLCTSRLRSFNRHFNRVSGKPVKSVLEQFRAYVRVYHHTSSWRVFCRGERYAPRRKIMEAISHYNNWSIGARGALWCIATGGRAHY